MAHYNTSRKKRFLKGNQPSSPFVFVYSFSVQFGFEKAFQPNVIFQGQFCGGVHLFWLHSWCQNQHKNRLFNDNNGIVLGPYSFFNNELFWAKKCDLNMYQRASIRGCVYRFVLILQKLLKKPYGAQIYFFILIHLKGYRTFAF